MKQSRFKNKLDWVNHYCFQACPLVRRTILEMWWIGMHPGTCLNPHHANFVSSELFEIEKEIHSQNRQTSQCFSLCSILFKPAWHSVCFCWEANGPRLSAKSAAKPPRTAQNINSPGRHLIWKLDLHTLVWVCHQVECSVSVCKLSCPIGAWTLMSILNQPMHIAWPQS